MGGWLQKVNKALTPKLTNQLTKPQQKRNAPIQGKKAANLPPATIIYGIGAGLLFVHSLSLMARGIWFSGIVVLLLGGVLTGFALHHLKHQD